MRDRFDDIRSAGGEVLVVSMGRPETVAAYFRMRPWPFPVVADPDRGAYRAFGLGRTSWGRFFRPRVLLHYLKLIFKGWRVRRPNPEEDLLQLGGDFVLDRQRRLLYAHRSADPSDRPTAEELLAAIRSARATT